MLLVSAADGSLALVPSNSILANFLGAEWSGDHSVGRRNPECVASPGRRHTVAVVIGMSWLHVVPSAR